MVWTIIIILLTAADQLLKAVVNRNLTSVMDRITVIDQFFYIILRKNRGAAWSFLAEPIWGLYLLAGVSFVVTLVLLAILYRTRNAKLQACLTLICAGSLGNFIDRVRDGAVTDFLDFHFGNYIFPTFNLADMLIVCGTILLCLLILIDPNVISKIGWPWKKQKPDDIKDKTEENHAANHPDQ